MTSIGSLFKIGIITSFILGAFSFSHAQVVFRKFSVGLGSGATLPFADTTSSDVGVAINLQANYHFNAYISVGLQYQGGTLNAFVAPIEIDPLQRRFVNNYLNVNANFKVQLGTFLYHVDSGFLTWFKRIYFGIGVGAVRNNISDIERGMARNEVERYMLEGINKSNDLQINGNLGFLAPVFVTPQKHNIDAIFDAGLYYTLGEGLDGYNSAWMVNLLNQNPKNDYYFYFSISLVYTFGGLDYTYRRPKKRY